MELTEEQRALYPELAGLRDKITELQDSEYNLRNQLYYNTGAADVAAGTATNKISYTYWDCQVGTTGQDKSGQQTRQEWVKETAGMIQETEHSFSWPIDQYLPLDDEVENQ